MSEKLWISLSVGLLLFACTKGEMKTVQTQQVGEYTLTVLSDSGSIKNGANDFVLEFRKTGDGQLVDVGTRRRCADHGYAGNEPYDGKRDGHSDRYSRPLSCNGKPQHVRALEVQRQVRGRKGRAPQCECGVKDKTYLAHQGREREILKSDKSCISNPKPENPNWTVVRLGLPVQSEISAFRI